MLCLLLWQVLLQLEPAGSETVELALEAGGWGVSSADYPLPGFRNRYISNQGRRGCLEDVGKLFLIGAEGLQRISQELGSNGVIVIKYGATCDQSRHFQERVSNASRSGQGASAWHTRRKGSGRCLQSCGMGENRAPRRMSKGAVTIGSRVFRVQPAVWTTVDAWAVKGHWWFYSHPKPMLNTFFPIKKMPISEP